jgi:hypothetical protein
MDAMYPAKNRQAEYGSIYPMEADLLRAKLAQRQVTALKELLHQYSGVSETSETVDPKTGNLHLRIPDPGPHKSSSADSDRRAACHSRFWTAGSCDPGAGDDRGRYSDCLRRSESFSFSCGFGFLAAPMRLTESVDEWVELWDFHKHRQVAKAHIATYAAGLWARTGPVRFTSDGRFVVAACARAVIVFDAGTLNLVRTIELTLPAESRYTRLTSTFADCSGNGFKHVRLLRETAF